MSVFTTDDIQKDNVGRPSGLVPIQTKARKAWISCSSSRFSHVTSQVTDRLERFELYKAMDDEVVEVYTKMLADANLHHTKVDVEQTLLDAAALVMADFDHIN